MEPVSLFLAMMLKGFVMGLYSLITGKEAFPANPKGPLYKWFGKPKGASHDSPPTPSQLQNRDRLLERLSELPDRPHAPRFRVLGRRR
jgi:hypothetical protein